MSSMQRKYCNGSGHADDGGGEKPDGRRKMLKAVAVAVAATGMKKVKEGYEGTARKLSHLKEKLHKKEPDVATGGSKGPAGY